MPTTPSNAPTPIFQPYLGDYVHLLCVGKNFYGIFSANNTPTTRTSRRECAISGQATSQPSSSSRPTASRRSRCRSIPSSSARPSWRRTPTSTSATGPTASPAPTQDWSLRRIRVFYTTSDVWNRQIRHRRRVQRQRPAPERERAQWAGAWATTGPSPACTASALGPAATVTLRFLRPAVRHGQQLPAGGRGAGPDARVRPARSGQDDALRTRVAAGRADDHPRLPRRRDLDAGRPDRRAEPARARAPAGRRRTSPSSTTTTRLSATCCPLQAEARGP